MGWRRPEMIIRSCGRSAELARSRPPGAAGEPRARNSSRPPGRPHRRAPAQTDTTCGAQTGARASLRAARRRRRHDGRERQLSMCQLGREHNGISSAPSEGGGKLAPPRPHDLGRPCERSAGAAGGGRGGQNQAGSPDSGALGRPASARRKSRHSRVVIGRPFVRPLGRSAGRSRRAASPAPDGRRIGRRLRKR